MTGTSTGHAPGTSVFANRDFRLLFAATTVGRLGTQISYLAIPLTAVLALDASPGQVGLVALLQTVAFLAIGLPAGAWVDRLRKRPVMIIADVARGLLFGWVPVAWWLDVLTIGQLYAVVLLAGVATVFAEIAAQSYLPVLVGREGLISANSTLVSVDAINMIGGRSLGGFLIQALTAPVAIVVDAASYLWSAVCLLFIRRREPAPARTEGTRLAGQIGEGLRFVFGDATLRALAVVAALTNLAVNLSIVMTPVLLTRELGLPASAVGLYFGTGGVGVLLGSLTAKRVGARLGQGRSQWILALVTAPFAFLTPLIDHGPMLWLGGFAWLVNAYRIGVGNVIQVSLRQHLTPDPILGRMNATMRFVLTGAVAVGAGLAGLIGELVSVRAALWASAVGTALVWLPAYLSPMRDLRALPRQPAEEAASP